MKPLASCLFGLKKMTSDSIGLVLQQGSFAGLTLAAGMNLVEEKCTCGDIETQCQTYKQFFD